MISKNLKTARKYVGLTQGQLAKEIGTTKSTISNYENGYSTPSNEALVSLSTVLGVTVDFLLSGSHDKLVESEEWISEIMRADPAKKEAIRNIWNEIKDL